MGKMDPGLAPKLTASNNSWGTVETTTVSSIDVGEEQAELGLELNASPA